MSVKFSDLHIEIQTNFVGYLLEKLSLNFSFEIKEKIYKWNSKKQKWKVYAVNNFYMLYLIVVVNSEEQDFQCQSFWIFIIHF